MASNKAAKRVKKAALTIHHSALHVQEANDGLPERIVIRGVIDAKELDRIIFDDYQRCELRSKSLKRIAEGLKNGTVLPNIDLGMRGGEVRNRENTHFLYKPVFCIDGKQRITVAKRLFEEEGLTFSLGATIHLDTNYQWEMERFKQLNAFRTSVSGNVLLRNMKKESKVVAMLYRLTTEDSGFPLYRKCQWDQYKGKCIITGTILLKMAAMIHSHWASGLLGSSRDDLVRSLEAVFPKIGERIFRDNVKTLFELINEIWGLTEIVYVKSAPQLGSNFLYSLTSVLADHPIFWKDRRLKILQPEKGKLKKFPLNDPSVIQMAGGSGKIRNVLQTMIIKHINSSRRSRKIRTWKEEEAKG